MRTVTLDDGTTLDVRGLTGKEVKALRKAGFNPGYPDPATFDDGLESLLEMVLTEAELERLDSLCHANKGTVFRAVVKETYGSREEEKNSSATSGGEPTESA